MGGGLDGRKELANKITSLKAFPFLPVVVSRLTLLT